MTPFRLASLLRLRRAQEDQVAGELAFAARARLNASERAVRQRDALGSHRTPASCTSIAWTASVAARAALSTASIEARSDEIEAEVVASEAMSAWHEARRRSTALEHLETRHAEAVVREQRRAEQLRLDEHTAAITGRQRGEDES